MVIINTANVPYLRLSMIFTKIPNHATQSAVNTAVNVVSSFIIYHLPLTVVLISTITTSRSESPPLSSLTSPVLNLTRRQPEHFMKVSCQRMGIILAAHLVVSALQFSLFSFLQCHNYDLDIKSHQYVCSDHLHAETRSFSTSPAPPNPATEASATNVSLMVLNILSQLLLPFIPASFLYTVRTILAE